MGIIVTLLVLSLVVLVHEYGHYFAMRRNGVQVVEFTIGFGPTLWSTKLKSGTIFAIKPILLGGYTRPVAEGPTSMAAASPWAKFKIAAAGPMANAVAGFVTMLVITYGFGMTIEVLEGFVSWAPDPLRPLLVSFMASFGLVLLTPPLIVYLIAVQGMEFMNGAAGPVGIMQMGSQVTDAATATGSPSLMLLSLLGFFHLINVALGGFNLIPMFPLDGGHCVTAVVEKVLPGSAGKINPLFRKVTGFLFLAFILFVIFGDFFKLAGYRF